MQGVTILVVLYALIGDSLLFLRLSDLGSTLRGEKSYA